MREKLQRVRNRSFCSFIQAVIPAQAGIQFEFTGSTPGQSWAPAFAGVTELVVGHGG